MAGRKGSSSCSIILALAAGALMAVVAHAIEKVEPALLYPVDRVYPLVSVTVGADAKPSPEQWARAFAGEGFFAAEKQEEEGARTVFRMLKSDERLYLQVEFASRGTAENKESVEFYVTQSDKRDFPCIAVSLLEDGTGMVGRVRRPHTWWNAPQAWPIEASIAPREVSATQNGWMLELSLPFDELGIPRDGFYFDIVHGKADGERYAWCDLGGKTGPSNQFALYARAVSVKDAPPAPNGLKLPAPLMVGLNRLSLEKPDAGARLLIGNQVVQPRDGAFDVFVRTHGPLDLRLTDGAGNVAATYHADVRRPFLIDAKERYLPADAKEFELDIPLDIAGVDMVDVALTCRRGNGAAEEHKVSLKPGFQTVKLPVPEGDGNEVRVTANAVVALPGNAQPLELEAMHWFMIGVTDDQVYVYREGIRDLPLDKLCWAIIVDVMPGLLNSQQGNGRYGTDNPDRWGQMSPQMSVYIPALLYKTNRPDNPFFGDKRLLQSAVMGMEYGLRPELRVEEYAIPDGRSPQSFLMTYDLIKDDIEPERRAYWEEELKHRTEGQIATFLRRVVDKYSFYSIDCDTSTNVMAYHIPDVYLAGKLFGRQDWMDLAAMLGRRLARHGRDGHFDEQAGSSVNHYTWMTTCSLGEYYHWSGDPEALPTLQACARYMTATTTCEGGVMSLHDSRTSGYGAFGCGEFVLALTPEGRRAARAVITDHMGDTPARLRGERLFKLAEDATFIKPGDEEDVFNRNWEFPFAYGIIVRKDGFHYGLSTIARGPVSSLMVVEAQNAIEIYHNDVGRILSGGGSQGQPEAGSFWRKLNEPDWEGKTVATANDYLPTAALLSAIPNGNNLGLAYRTFEADVAVQVLSPKKARLEVFAATPKGPVTFSFFPGVGEREEIVTDADRTTLRFRQVTLRANKPFTTDKGFRMFNPYSGKYVYTYKPVRCWLELKDGETFTLDIDIDTYIRN